MTLVHTTYSGFRSVLHTVGSAFLVVVGFFLVFFITSTPHFGGLGMSGTPTAHAEAPTSCGGTGGSCGGACGCEGGCGSCGSCGSCGCGACGCGSGCGQGCSSGTGGNV